MSDERFETREELRRRRLVEISRLPPNQRVQALKELAAELAKHERELQQEEASTQQEASEAEELTKKSEEEVATLERLLPKTTSVKVEDVLKVTQAEAKKAEDKALEEQVQEATTQAVKVAAQEKPYAELHQRSTEELYARFKDLRDQLHESKYSSGANQSGSQASPSNQTHIIYEIQQIGQEAHYRNTHNQGQNTQQQEVMGQLEEWASKYHT